MTGAIVCILATAVLSTANFAIGWWSRDCLSRSRWRRRLAQRPGSHTGGGQ
jgi:hypothetical protein